MERVPQPPAPDFFEGWTRRWDTEDGGVWWNTMAPMMTLNDYGPRDIVPVPFLQARRIVDSNRASNRLSQNVGLVIVAQQGEDRGYVADVEDNDAILFSRPLLEPSSADPLVEALLSMPPLRRVPANKTKQTHSSNTLRSRCSVLLGPVKRLIRSSRPLSCQSNTQHDLRSISETEHEKPRARGLWPLKRNPTTNYDFLSDASDEPGSSNNTDRLAHIGLWAHNLPWIRSSDRLASPDSSEPSLLPRRKAQEITPSEAKRIRHNLIWTRPADRNSPVSPEYFVSLSPSQQQAHEPLQVPQVPTTITTPPSTSPADLALYHQRQATFARRNIRKLSLHTSGGELTSSGSSAGLMSSGVEERGDYFSYRIFYRDTINEGTKHAPKIPIYVQDTILTLPSLKRNRHVAVEIQEQGLKSKEKDKILAPPQQSETASRSSHPMHEASEAPREISEIASSTLRKGWFRAELEEPHGGLDELVRRYGVDGAYESDENDQQADDPPSNGNSDAENQAGEIRYGLVSCSQVNLVQRPQRNGGMSAVRSPSRERRAGAGLLWGRGSRETWRPWRAGPGWGRVSK